MQIKSVKIKSPLPIERVREVLQNRIQEKFKYSMLLKGEKIFIGEFKDNRFKLETHEAPPIKVSGELLPNDTGTTIDLKVNAPDAIKSGISGLMYGLGFPIIASGFLIGVIKDPTNFWVYFWTIFASLLLYSAVKFHVWMSYNDPNPDELITQLATILEGDVLADTIEQG